MCWEDGWLDAKTSTHTQLPLRKSKTLSRGYFNDQYHRTEAEGMAN